MFRVLDNIEEIDRASWEDLLREASVKSFFQTPQCYDLYSAMSFMEPFVFAVADEEVLVALMMGYVQKDGGALKSFLSRRAIVNGGPVLRKFIGEVQVDSNTVLPMLLSAAVKQLKGKAIYLETRNFDDYSALRPIFERCGFRYQPHLNFHIDTSSVDTMEGNLGKSRKRDIRYTIREGAKAVDLGNLAETESAEASFSKLNEFYLLLSDLYRTKVRTPLFPFEFFRNLLGREYAKIFLVEYQGKVIGGTVNVCLEGYAVYEWFACGWDGHVKNVFPSTLATYSGMKYAAENGFPRFDMMGAGKPGEDYGVRDFKAKFGGTMVEHGRFLHVFNPLLYIAGKFGVRVLKGNFFKKLRKK